MPEFLLELFSEEIPALMQPEAADQLAEVVWSIALELDPGVSPEYGEWLTSFRGPRRLAVSAIVASEKPAQLLEFRGPKDTAPEAAINGFLRKHQAEQKDLTVEGGYYILRKEIQSESARLFIERKLPELIVSKVEWPKSMRWGQSGDFGWVRPLRRITCLLDDKVVPIKLGPVTANNLTEGCRALTPAGFAVSSANQWKEELRTHKVIVDHNERRKRITEGLRTIAATKDLMIVEDVPLLEEVNGLVEWPVPLLGKIDPDFMLLPSEVRELSMKVNQKYFALRDADGKPAPYFAFVANLDAPDGGATIIAGNERVLRARLSDARHFWERDLQTPLNELLPKLDGITFHAKIGTQRERAERVAALADLIAGQLDGDGNEAQWAGLLCKADLVTGMVGEFPELQGIMGGYYAEKNPRGWDGGIVGPAIRTHYQPKGPNDAVPVGIVPASVALADKLDTLVQFFRIGEVPTGSGDPYALRRAALGVIRIILENGLRLPLRPLLGDDEKLFAFIIERLRVKLRGEARRFDVLDAVLGAGTDDDLVRVMHRADAVSAFLAGPDGANLIIAYRRAANILRIEDGKDGPHRATELQRSTGDDEETELADALARVENETIEDFLAGRYAQAMAALAKLRVPVDAFFDKVTVNAAEPELRLNRLRLLALLRDTMNRIADFSKIEG